MSMIFNPKVELVLVRLWLYGTSENCLGSVFFYMYLVCSKISRAGQDPMCYTLYFHHAQTHSTKQFVMCIKVTCITHDISYI